MLLDFSVENYKSFLKKVQFSMTPAPKQHGLDYSILTEKIGRKSIKGLCSSVIYGPNASGKTNIIGAMDALRAIVLRGNIRNAEEQSSPNKAAYDLELIPNNLLEDIEPVVFKISFVDNSMKFDYELSILLGTFLEDTYQRSVKCEKLLINEEMMFERTDKVHLGDYKKIGKYIPGQTLKNSDAVSLFANQSLAEDELFLSNGFKLLVSPKLSKTINDWFAEKFMVIYRADAIQLIRRFSDPQKKTAFVEKTTNEAAKIFGINSNSVAYVANGDDGEAKLCSIFKDKEDENSAKAVWAEVFESYGTIRFINLFPVVLRAIATGGTLVVDEFDASIHPMALMSIINVFHNDDINKKRAQLIFNTHNPIFLNSNIFRRDEIKFVEKNDDSLLSEVYSLSDFGTSGENGVRKGDDYMKNYFISQYGAIKTIDFSPIFESEVLEEGNDGE
jgi:AAA15 family ATPase/GTPase